MASAISLDQMIALAASIGACASAVATFLTIAEIKRQRESAYQPELVLSSVRIQGMTKATGGFPEIWLTPDEHLTLAEESRPEAQIPIINIGLGAAKSVNAEWSFAVDEVIELINREARETNSPVEWTYTSGAVGVRNAGKSAGESFWVNQKRDRFDYILTADTQRDQASLLVPYAYLDCVSALLHFWSKRRMTVWPQLPELRLDLSYVDVAGKHHTSAFSVTCECEGIGDAEFRAFLKASRLVFS